MKLFHEFATLATAPDKPACFIAISSAVPAESLSCLSILLNSFLDLMRLFNVTTFDSPTNAILSAVFIPDLAMLSNASFKPPAFSGLNASFLDTDNLSNVDFNCEPARVWVGSATTCKVTTVAHAEILTEEQQRVKFYEFGIWQKTNNATTAYVGSATISKVTASVEAERRKL